MDDDDTAWALVLAEWLGVHALLAYLIGLGLVLVATAMIGIAMRRLAAWTSSPRDPADNPTASLPIGFMVRLGVGFAIVMACAALFAEMLEAFDADETLGRFDSRLTEVLAGTTAPTVLRAFSLATHLGDPLMLTAIVILVAIALAARGRRALAAGWVIAAAGSGILNHVLKGIFERVRPLHEHGFAVADGFSFPSGHTSGSVVIYGMLAYLALRLMRARIWLPTVLVAAGLAWSMGASRVILQVHWASDVVAGFGSGLAWLVVCILGIESLRHWRRRRR